MTRDALMIPLALASLLPFVVRADEASRPPPVGPPVVPFAAIPLPVHFAPDLRPRIFVKDLDHLAELVKEDPAVAEKARALATRERSAYAVAGLSLVAGLLVTVIGATRETCESQPTGIGRGTFEVCRPSGDGLVVAGSLLSLGGLAIGAAIHPSRNDFLDVVNGWNRAHRDRPLDLFPVPTQVLPPPDAAVTGPPDR